METRRSVQKMTPPSISVFEHNLAIAIMEWVTPSPVIAISAIGSYTLDRKVRPGSDVDVVVVVPDLAEFPGPTTQEVINKRGRVDDPEGKRFEFNAMGPENVLVDVTVIDAFNIPNNPMRDQYENHLGWCGSALTLFGPPLAQLFDLDRLIHDYEKIRHVRLSLVLDKIATTKKKISAQGRHDLHILFELQQYVFVREVIASGIFNRQSIKHAEDAVPGFADTFAQELRACGIKLSITRIAP